MATVKSKAPTGLAIKRNKQAFTLSWKFGEKDYNDGQTCKFRCNNDAWVNQSVGTGTKSKTATVDYSKYYPHTSKFLRTVWFALRGNQKAYTTKDANKKDVTIDPTVSDWVYKDFAINPPSIPTGSVSLSQSDSNVCTFSWKANNDTASHIHFYDCEWQSVLLRESAITDGSKVSFSSKIRGWRTGTTTGATGSVSITEETGLLAGASYTRWVRVRARGAGGASPWRYLRHVYARPNQAVIKSAKAKQNTAGGYLCTVEWVLGSPPAHPADHTIVEYCYAVPETGMACPDGVSWTEAGTVRDTATKDRLAFSIDSMVGTDQCMFVRVNSVHDTNTTYGAAKAVVVGKLADPSDLVVSNIDATTFRATVTASNNSTVSDSFLEVRYVTKKNTTGTTVGIIPHGQTTITVQCPDWSGETAYGFKVRAVVGSYTATPGGAAAYAVTAKMHSAHWLTYGGSIPQAPDSVSLAMTDVPGTVQVTFDWTWTEASAAELSWADHADAWESTDEPDTYVIRNTRPSRWNISGLETGVTWYVRVRLMSGSEDDPTYGTYSEIVSIDLSSAPVTPVLTLSKGVIAEGESVTAAWVYTSTDGTLQSNAEICEYVSSYALTEDVTIDEGKTYYVLDETTTGGGYPNYVVVEDPDVADIGTYYEHAETYSGIIASTDSAQHITIDTSGWTTGEEHLLAVRVVSDSGRETDWSDPVSVIVAEPIEIEISSISLDTETEDNETVYYLTEMPLTVTIEGAGEGGTTAVTITRAQDYQVDRPDETTFNGFDGETILAYSQTGEAEININQPDLVGSLDDGAQYTLTATVTDGLGQSASESITFWVAWTHQAIIPEATCSMDTEHLAAIITPIAPTGTLTGDTCDIYRLSVDKPQLIYKDAQFGTAYVDPYPTIGDFGGHRVVFKTANGDYITEDSEMAWVDIGPADDDVLNTPYNIIDFATGKAMLQYNVDVSNGWSKDFKETKYLGGSVQGDWNPAVSRSSSVSSVAIAYEDNDTIEAMRRLAAYSGICHVRTKEGSSYPADVQVSESYAVSNGHRIASFSLKITRVDPEDLDGMTLAEWQNVHQEE